MMESEMLELVVGGGGMLRLQEVELVVCGAMEVFLHSPLL